MIISIYYFLCFVLLIPVSFYTVIQMDNYMNIYQPVYKITFVHQIVSSGSHI